MDMWVSPAFLISAYDSSIPWLPAKGIGERNTYCGEGTDLLENGDMPWWENSKALGLEALQRIPHIPKGWTAGKLCFGHADLYYVPFASLRHWHLWTHTFEHVMHECAVPTLIHMAAAALNTEPLDTACLGHCCAFLGNPDLSTARCAHRIDLELPGLQQQMRELLKDASSSGRLVPQARALFPPRK
jgi:hypothetical protein